MTVVRTRSCMYMHRRQADGQARAHAHACCVQAQAQAPVWQTIEGQGVQRGCLVLAWRRSHTHRAPQTLCAHTLKAQWQQPSATDTATRHIATAPTAARHSIHPLPSNETARAATQTQAHALSARGLAAAAAPLPASDKPQPRQPRCVELAVHTRHDNPPSRGTASSHVTGRRLPALNTNTLLPRALPVPRVITSHEARAAHHTHGTTTAEATRLHASDDTRQPPPHLCCACCEISSTPHKLSCCNHEKHHPIDTRETA
jgi:hypothetical protein